MSKKSKSDVGCASVERMAALAHIHLPEEELGHLVGRFNEVVRLFASLPEFAVAPDDRPQEGSGERDDEPRPSLAPELVLEQAPVRQGFAFQVPRIIE